MPPEASEDPSLINKYEQAGRPDFADFSLLKNMRSVFSSLYTGMAMRYFADIRETTDLSPRRGLRSFLKMNLIYCYSRIKEYITRLIFEKFFEISL